MKSLINEISDQYDLNIRNKGKIKSKQQCVESFNALLIDINDNYFIMGLVCNPNWSQDYFSKLKVVNFFLLILDKFI